MFVGEGAIQSHKERWRCVIGRATKFLGRDDRGSNEARVGAGDYGRKRERDFTVSDGGGSEERGLKEVKICGGQ